MSVSNINNTTPDQVPWANLSCNSLTCNSLSVQNPVESKFPTTAETLNIAAAVNSITNSLTFNSASFSGSTFSQVTTGSPYIVASEPGVYIVNLFIEPVVMGTATDSYGNITMVFKSDNGSGGNYSELAEVTSAITDTDSGAANKYRITQVFSVPVANTRLQVLFRRQNAAVNPGTIVVPQNNESAISFLKLA